MKKTGIMAGFAALLFLCGCCHKMLCTGDTFTEVRFYGFEFHDLDTVRFEAYDGADTLSRYTWLNEQKQENGYISLPVSAHTLIEPYTPKSLRFWVPGTGQVYEITDFNYKEDQCKSGICRQEFRNLDFYRVNGEVQSLQDLALRLTH